LRILLTGRNGQVGWELERALMPIGDVVATDRSTLDLSDVDAIRRVVRETRPEVIVNAAAYTAVDQAESESDFAMRINGVAPGVLADEAKGLGALLLHFSSDYVFDGTKATSYVETDVPIPINTYGASKLAGEQAIQSAACRHLIIRTTWVYAARGSNFLLTMLRLAGERPELRVIDDQVGAPTWARDIAVSTATVLRRGDPESGVYHMTAAGVTTWCRFAREIFRQMRLEIPVKPITSAEYPTAARRPAYSVMSNEKLLSIFGFVLPEWSSALERCLADIR
jgi:dTDP-4-dehydrorhamnose reductase